MLQIDCAITLNQRHFKYKQRLDLKTVALVSVEIQAVVKQPYYVLSQDLKHVQQAQLN